jgi:hypothetical protein
MVGAMAAMFAISAILMEWRRSRWTNAPHAFLACANIHMSADVRIPAHLYTAMVVCSTLTAAPRDLTSTVLQKKPHRQQCEES